MEAISKLLDDKKTEKGKTKVKLMLFPGYVTCCIAALAFMNIHMIGT